jgi:mRNA interferase MazF
MTTYEPGDVVLVPFLFTDQSGTKQRPAVVISRASYNRAHPDIILAPITTRATPIQDEVVLRDWQEAGLLRPSVVKPLLSSFDARLVRRHLGALSLDDLASVRTMLGRILDLL